MTIQRQYVLPNCNLILEGLGSNGDDPSGTLTVLMNVECHLLGTQEKPISGGREFLENLIAAVSRYAQRLLSGITAPDQTDAPKPVEVKPDGDYHHLIVRPQSESMSDDRLEEAFPRDIRLNTIQFFDLVDALDQLISDANTLPDLSAPVRPISRRHVRPMEPAAKRAAPAAIGAGALAAAAVALFFVPLPEVEPSRSTGTSAEPSVETLAEEDSNLPAVEGPGADAESDVEDLAPGAAGVDQLSRETTVDSATEAALIAQVQTLLEETWEPESPPSEPLSYRITTSAGGDILGYKYADDNEAALNYADQTPLPELTYLPVDPAEPVEEPVAQFRVVFNPNGSVEVTPWSASEAAALEAGSANQVAAPSDIDTEIATPIDELEPLRQLNRGLREEIAIAWEAPDLDQDLTYRVRLNAEGDILGYEAVDAPGDAPVPFADLMTEGNITGPQADFKVVFTQDGIIQVSPWDGWPD